MSQIQFKKLFDTFLIGQMQLKNRIVMAPMGCGYAEDEGYIGQRLIDYYEARAMGGVGLIVIEATAPHMQCKGSRQLTLGDDSYFPGWRKLIEAIHKHGAKVVIQLVHSSMEIRDGKSIQVAPSPVIVPSRMMGVSGKIPHELNTDEISQIEHWFADAARRAKEVGFDGVEIHAAHQYLIASFLSSATNVRQDKYGGMVENKARFLVEILQAMRKTVGPDYPVWPRLNALEYGVEHGITVEETKQVVPMIVSAGAQAVHVSAYGAGSYAAKAPLPDMPGFLLPLTEEVKKVTSVPVIAVGRLGPEIGEQILKEGKADLIVMGRRLMADPELPKKVAEGRLDEVRPCIGCMECLERVRAPGDGVTCTVNAVMGREREYRIEPADRIKRVMVIGGGPAGMEAARVLALRGHQVVLFERESGLGGKLKVAAVPPHKDDILPLIDYLASQVKKAGVEIMLGTEATPQLIRESKPDAVVVATGAVPVIPETHAEEGSHVVIAQDVLSGKVEVGQSAVVVGGGMIGCETGHYLAEQGKKVTIIEMLNRMADDMRPIVRRRLMDGLRTRQVTMLASTKCEEIMKEGVVVTMNEGQKEMIRADTVILAVGYEIKDDLVKQLEGEVPEVYCVGDAAEPRRIMEAIVDGYRTGLAL